MSSDARSNPAHHASNPQDRLASWALRGPLPWAIALLCVAQLATWIPHYLTWPWFADHDVFATLAQGWDAGLMPYRDLAGNNFPGTVYLFWVLGRAFGWGRTVPFYAVDAGLVCSLGVAMILWSRRRFARILPGLVGYATFLSYYLALDYSRAGQRDWHGPLLMVMGLMAAECGSGWGGRIVSALLAALALSFRPQVVLLVPAMMLAVARPGTEPGRSRWEPAKAVLAWGLAFGLFTALAFVPLVEAGIVEDFLRGVRLTMYGSRYNQVGPSLFFRQMVLQAMTFKFVIVPVAILALATPTPTDLSTRLSVRIWLVALAGAFLYKPLSPVPYPYLTHALVLVWSMNVAVLTHLTLLPKLATPAVRLVVVLLTLGLSVDARPEFCSVQRSLLALKDLARGIDPVEPPLGYLELPVDLEAVPYPWRDYRATLEHLRRGSRPEVRVANLLRVVPALTGPTARLPALPAESLAWLLVKPDDEAAFVKALERAGDSVVVWSPREALTPEWMRLASVIRRFAPVIRRLYEPKARFGMIEVWRRKDGGPSRRTTRRSPP